jgi:hypothetical protein
MVRREGSVDMGWTGWLFALHMLVGAGWWYAVGRAGWPGLVVVGLGVGALMLWAATARTVTVLDRDGLSIRTWPFPTRWVPREDIVAIRIREHLDPGVALPDRRHRWPEDPTTSWTVAVRTRARELVMSEVAHWDEARALAAELAEALGDVPVEDLSPGA